MPIHVHPTAELAPRALLPGDPGRALALAQVLLDEPRMFNHNRGLWGYTGPAKADGAPLTIQSTGMGGPSAAIVVHELIELGLEVAIRVGTCGALLQELALGDLVVAGEALAQDGASRMLGAGDRAAADPALTQALSGAARAPAQAVVSHDLFYDPADRISEWTSQGAVAVEMEAATLFAACAARGVRAGCLLAVSDTLLGERARLDHDGLVAAGERLGAVAVEALR
jgi:DeoD family purine-nucleoside phosphorylase